MTTVSNRSRGLPDEVASYVRELIFSGKVRPGEFLRLEPIAEAVGVSNTPVREGLLALSNEGFVRLVPRRGFMVESFTADDVHDLFWTQAKLAGELAARAAKRITDDELAEIEAILEREENAYASHDRDLIAQTGDTFHRRIHRAARSPRLAQILSSVAQYLPARFYAELEGHVAAVHDDHRRVLEALKAHKVSVARKLEEEHILQSTDRLIEMLRARGLWQDEERTA